MKSDTKLGGINVSVQAVASMTGAIVSECYGVVGMASKKFFKDGLAVLLRQENYSKGVVVKETKEGLELEIYVIICYGVRITEVVSEIQKKVKYQLGKTLDMDITAINVFVQGVKVVD
ncbi:MAG: Asp23/Gls24 family envelope stress response protein [Erysipelotrichaceae bacterium]|nr:Asp23/Gls24 family envelope stress response protein [Erysipelotrichaceae bacterium]